MNTQTQQPRLCIPCATRTSRRAYLACVYRKESFTCDGCGDFVAVKFDQMRTPHQKLQAIPATKWTFVRWHLWQNISACAQWMLLHPIGFPKVLMARYRFFKNRSFRAMHTLHGFSVSSPQEFLSYWEMFIEKALHGEWMKAINSRVCPVIVDVGANAGMFSKLVKQVNASAAVYCVEPQSGFANRLKVDPNVARVFEVAASDVHAAIEMHVTGECAHVGTEFGRDFTHTIPAIAAPLDSLDLPLTIDLLKIDVDGHEVQALKGAAKTLKRTKAVLIEVMSDEIFEIVRPMLGEFSKVERLDSINYCFSRP